MLELVVSTQPGGGPQHVYALATALAQRGFTPVIGGPRDGSLFAAFAAAGLETLELRTDRLSAATVGHVARLVRDRGIRLIHSHGKGAGLYGRLVARASRIPSVHTFHGIHFERYAAPARAAYLALERRLARWTGTVINVSHAQEAEGLALRLFTPAQSRVVPNGVDVERLGEEAMERSAARARLGIEPDAIVVGCAARFDPVKRLDLLLHATAAITPAIAVLIGRGPETERLQQRCRALGLGSRARLVGEIPDAWRLFRAFDVYVATSTKEGMPVAVLEAMALGLPIVATDIPAHRETLGGAADTLVEPTPAAIAKAILDLAGNPRRRERQGEANRARARAEFTIDRMVDAVARVYGDALGS